MGNHLWSSLCHEPCTYSKTSKDCKQSWYGIRHSAKNCKHGKVYQPIDYILSDDTILQPDLLVVCKKIEKRFLDFPPGLVVEILSPSTALKDRHTKYGLYEKHGVKYYLIVSPESEQVEVFNLQDGEYQLAAKGRCFHFDFDIEGCNAAIDFAEIW